MNKIPIYLLVVIFISSNCSSQTDGNTVRKALPKQLKEISGIAAAGNYLWAISDRPHPVFFKLSKKGELLQEIRLSNVTVNDVEAVAADDKYVYIGDVGDNEGDRKDRKVIRVALKGIAAGASVEASGEAINFSFPDDVLTDKKKMNDYDCESVMSYNDSLYLFTKRRTDDQSELFVIPKTPGTYVARFIAAYDTKGLVTDAAINSSKSEVALTGYEKGHKSPFILFFKNFKGNNFFSGKAERVELSKKKTDWQVEGVSYMSDNVVYLSCEETKDVPATLYAGNRNSLANVSGKK